MSSFRRRRMPLAFLPIAPAILMALILASAVSVSAAPGNQAAGTRPVPAMRPSASALDTAAVRRHYMDGDFEPAIDLLENTLKAKSGLNRVDSAFIFKHLGVMYAAKYDTREKGKLYMLRLLEIEPTARILDMYASDMIYMIFKNIQDEFEASRRRLARADSTLGGGQGAASRERPSSQPKSQSHPPKQAAKSSSAIVWVGATVAVAAAAAATWYYLADEPKAETIDHQP